MSSKVTH